MLIFFVKVYDKTVFYKVAKRDGSHLGLARVPGVRASLSVLNNMWSVLNIYVRNREKERQVHPICSLKLTNFEYRARKLIQIMRLNKIIKNGRHIFTNITVIKTKLFIYSFVLKKCPNLESFIYANSYLNAIFALGISFLIQR